VFTALVTIFLLNRVYYRIENLYRKFLPWPIIRPLAQWYSKLPCLLQHHTR
jgi:hypothetical protein